MNYYYRTGLWCSVLTLVLCQQIPALAQETVSTRHRLETAPGNKQRPLRDALLDLERRFKVYFTYESRLIRSKTVRADLQPEATLDASLLQVLQPHGLRYERISPTYYSIVNESAKTPAHLNRKTADIGVGPLLNTSVVRPTELGRTTDALTLPGRIADMTQQTVSGVVTDENNAPMVGVTVAEKGTTNGTVTDNRGRYSLSVRDERATLVFSFIGYAAREVVVGNQTVINPKLAPDTKALNEVVVVGYGTQRRASVTGAVDQVGQEAIQGRPVINVSQALQGISPNLVVQQNSAEPGAPLNINIRGISTLGNNSPLIIIDGIPGSLDVLNPSDIETISVLKDAGSAAIYGSRSANGVILVTTKKGSKTGRTNVSYNGSYGVQTPALLRRPVESWEYAVLKNEALVNSGLPAPFTPDQIAQFNRQGSYGWYLDEILKQQAPQQNHNLSVSGGNAQTTYHISAGYLNQNSQFKGPDFGLKRYNYRLNLTHQTGPVRLTSILAYSRTQIKEHAFDTGFIVADAARMPRTYPITDSLGRYVLSPILSESNPLALLEKGGTRQYDNDNVYGNVSAEWEVVKGFKLRGLFGGELNANHQYQFQRAINYLPYVGGTANTASIKDENQKSLFTNLQLMAQYDTQVKQHAISALLGFSNEGYTSQFNRVEKRDVDNDLGTDLSRTVVLPSTVNTNANTDFRTGQNALSSVFGRVNYSFADRYIAEFNFRYDGSSRFAAGNRWGFFPSVAAAWRLTEESFARGLRDRFGDWKLRASFGVLGNQNVGDFQYQSTYFAVPNVYAFNNAPVAGTGISLANPNITWERAQTFNLGLDAAVLRNRLTFSLDYFDKLTRDILINPSVPGLFGGNQGTINGAFPNAVPDFNAAQVRNQGWEVSATYRQTVGQARHSLTLNVADSRNRVVRLDGQTNINQIGELAIILKEGLPVRSYFGYQTDGYFQNLEQLQTGPFPSFVNQADLRPGDIRYKDQNGDGIINENDRVVLGNPFPRYTFGATYNVTWKGFDLNLFVQGVGRRAMFLRGEAFQPFHGPYVDAIFKHQTDYWTPVSPNAAYPRLTIGSASNNNYGVGSNFFLQNAAYARLKNVQFGYTLPGTLTRKIGLSRARIYYTGQNLVTLTRMQVGIDPESSEFNSNLGYADGKANSGRIYPNPMFNGLGLDLTF
ncbi:SusC/RagA family TonB-linked outer membrane protein [Spirosoma montaniterrae]|uniref:SusC/RagA family TonB-linked outer membrane protein n=1 Tax=Spirosoma montaniterrae TaxID=1178516 RepID=A0A1P9X075_9BACT|nr:TonB-dependent receptor [Spirosoma montaniterrae]AQG80985.1 SusC/RagA family TonB-linked outer membrane protein [Spirosoma montaniterrae]